MGGTRKRIGELLRDKGLLTDQQIDIAIQQQKITGDLLGVTFTKIGFVSAAEVAKALAEQADMPYLNLHEYTISEEALRTIPKDVAERVGFMPIDHHDGHLSIGLINPSNVLAVDTCTQLTKIPPQVYVIDSDAFYDLIDKSYYFMENPIQSKIESTLHRVMKSETVPADIISTLTELIVMDGIRRNATDIHITPEEEAVHVFFRIDGVLQHGFCYPKRAQNGIISKVKVLGKLDIAEQRLPQDGSFTYSFLNKSYDVRVSTIPTIYGENIVIRILMGSDPLVRLSALGFHDDDTGRLHELFNKPYGIILITGPTGSGKTTTLYAALREINMLERNVLTVEDPVEIRLSLAKQTEVNEKTGYDFALAGRNFMRQDPDIILIGEIRDEETAKIAIRASITGHLVLSTLHTNDSTTAIPRLLDLGVDRFLLSSSLLAVISQRLVRKICPRCRASYRPTESDITRLQFAGFEGTLDSAQKGKGCEVCSFRGYLGRAAIGEILVIDDEIKDLIATSASLKTIRDAARHKGMKFLREDGMRNVRNGTTTIDEVLRVVG